ncbi:MAG: histidine--tRNA ligase, partial [Nanoarchaeota archaeon]|nr:histidine--tRNA ligase [Nanoarchaeota archaeon]
MNYQTPKGTRDFILEDMRLRDYVMKKLETWFKSYAYQKMETPVFEYLEVLTKKSGEIENEIYTFKDKSGRDLALRFDLTVPLARVISSNSFLKKPFKRYCISRVWRYENPQFGRFREFWQADVDIVGLDTMECEVELLDLATKVCEDFGFKNYLIHLNNRKILGAFVRLAGIKPEKINDVFISLDKLDKIGSKGVKNEFLSRKLTKKNYDNFMENIKLEGSNHEKLNYLSNLFQNDEIGKEGVEEIKQIIYALEKLNLGNKVFIDLTLVRGLGYYTGPIFEIKSKDVDVGSFAGGGRYDDLIGLYGKESVPAVGVSFGLERFIEILKNINFKFESPTKMFIASIGNWDIKLEAMRIADKLRKKPFREIETNLSSKSLKKQLDYANKIGAKKVIIVGEKDIKEKKVTIKD